MRGGEGMKRKESPTISKYTKQCLIELIADTIFKMKESDNLTVCKSKILANLAAAYANLK